MNFARQLISELREKRLWPIAAALILALIAVPLLLSSSSTPVAAAPVPAAIGSAPAPALPAVSVTTTPSDARLTGRERNPFTQQVKPSSTTAGTRTGTAATSSGGGSSAKSTPGASTTTPVASTTTPASKPPTTTSTTPVAKQPALKYRYFEVNVVYGGPGFVPVTLDNLRRLTPLPKASDPLIVYLGIAKDRKTAVFLVSDIAHPTGQGRCLPSRSDCHFLELKAGQADLFKVVRPTGTDEFTLSMTAVKHLWTTSPAVAAAARARESEVGRKLVARATALHAIVYSKQTGTLTLHLSRKSVTRLPRTQGPQAAPGVSLQPRTATR